jgi:hypothetical protein
MKKLVVLVLLTISSAAAVAQKQITSPETAFGFKPGSDRKLADWNELTTYFKKLSDESDRIRYEELGKTTEGRPFIAVTISSAENLAHLEDYRKIQYALADPRVTSKEQAKQLIARGKTVLVVTCNIHSTEIASSQSASEFAYRLATGDSPEIKSILHNVIIVLVPSLNPDGEQLVVDWYKKYLGTPYEGSNPVVLWHHYTGHDDNRDWYAFTQVETQLTVDKVINAWRPQILYDLHQMGANGPRIYLPPWVDPIDPNIDPLLVSSMNALGTNTALEIAETGKQGILTNGVYDLWSPARHYMAYHGTLRILTESASVNIATPINIPSEKLDKGIGYNANVSATNFPDPWKGGTWRLGDIVAYQLDAFFSIAKNASDNRERYLSDFYEINKHAVEQKYGGPYAYVVPAEQVDSAATARLINILRRGLVEIQQATTDFDAGGHHYTAGSYIIPLAQPYGPFAKTLLEIQNYPNIEQYPGGPLRRPYDVTAQTLPLLFGVEAHAVQDKFAAQSVPVLQAKVIGHFDRAAKATGYLLADTANSDYYALFTLLKDHVEAYRLTGDAYDKGTIYFPQQPGIESKLATVAAKFPVEIKPALKDVGGSALKITLPRIALYQSWSPSMDEGWTRWIFDQYGIPYTRLVDADLRKGDLNNRFDTIIFPDQPPNGILHGSGGGGEGAGGPKPPPEFRGGIGDEGVAKLNEFTANGGTIISLNKSSEVYARKDSPDVTNVLANVAAKDFYVPGSILQIAIDSTNPLGFGSKAEVPVFFEQSPVFKVAGSARSIATYTTDHPLLSGWLLGGQYLKDSSALVELKQGQGRVILFGFRPQYRAQSEVTYKIFYNALLYSSSTPVSLGPLSAQARGSMAKTVSHKGGK